MSSDVALFSSSSLLLRILVESRSEGKDFEVVVVDGGPLYEGREMCRRLVAENIKCTYVLLPAFSFIVGQVSYRIPNSLASLKARSYLRSPVSKLGKLEKREKNRKLG